MPGTRKPRFFYGHIIVVAAFFIMMSMYGVYNTFGIFFNPVLTEFGWTRALTSGAFSLSWIVHGLLSIVMGGLNDRFGPRIVLTLCALLLGGGYLLMSQISAVWQLYFFYGIIIGSGLGGIWVPLMSTVVRWFSKRRGIATGIVASGIGIGTLIAAPAANWLISIYGWRVSYIILGSIVLVVVVLAAQFLRRDPAQVGQLPYGENGSQVHGSQMGNSGFSLKEAAHTKQFWLTSGMFFCFGFGVFAIIVHIVPHAIELGTSAAIAANILATSGGLSIVGKVVLGSAADRIGNRQVFIIGFIMMSAAFFWLVPATTAWMLYLFAVVFGIAYGGCAVAESPLAAGLFGLSSHGLILGVLVLGFSIGAAIGPLVAGYIFDTTGSYKVAFLILAAVSIIGLIITLFLKPIHRQIGNT